MAVFTANQLQPGGNTYGTRGGGGEGEGGASPKIQFSLPVCVRTSQKSQTELPVTLLVRVLSGWSCRLSLVLRRLTDNSSL